MPPDIRSEASTLANSDGVVSYAITGTGPAVLAIQGAGLIGRGWQPQVDSLSSQFRFITFDNRGIGASHRGKGPLTIERMALDALAVMDAAGVDRVHLLGHSMGGLIAQHLALTHRARVASLALLCTFADGARATRLSSRMLLLALRSRIGTRTMRRNGMLQMIMPVDYIRRHDSAALARDLGELFGRDLADQPTIVYEQLRAMSRYSALVRLGELSNIPTLVVSARHDPIAPPALGREIASRISGAQFVEFDDASHAVTIQLAGQVNDLLCDHLLKAESQSAARSARGQPPACVI
jgi:aminoacrylate hydrolase